MRLLKMVDVGHIQAGDILIFNNNRFTCEYVENDGIAFDLQLHDWKGNKIQKCLLAGEKVTLEM